MGHLRVRLGKFRCAYPLLSRLGLRQPRVVAVDYVHQRRVSFSRELRSVNRMRHALRRRCVAVAIRSFAADQVFLELGVELAQIMPQPGEAGDLAGAELGPV